MVVEDGVIVGGESARLQGFDRLTEDLDALVKRGVQNFTRLAAALKELGVALRVEPEFPGESSVVSIKITPEFLAAGQSQRYTPHGDIDILITMCGPDRPMGYEDVIENSTTLPIEGSLTVSP